jgi:hypothetical protein
MQPRVRRSSDPKRATNEAGIAHTRRAARDLRSQWRGNRDLVGLTTESGDASPWNRKKGGSKCRLFLLVGAKVLLAVIIPAVVESYQAAEVADKAVERRVVAQTSRVPYTRRRELREQTSGVSRAFYVVQMDANAGPSRLRTSSRLIQIKLTRGLAGRPITLMFLRCFHACNSCRPRAQTRQDAGPGFCPRTGAKRLLRQTRPVPRLSHPKGTVGGLTFCELSA